MSTKTHLDTAIQSVKLASESADVSGIDPLQVELMSAFEALCRARRLWLAREDAKAKAMRVA